MASYNGRWRTRFFERCFPLGFLAMVGALPVTAQESGATHHTIEEVVVTASKRATNILETPLAITALTQDALYREGVKTARDLNGLVPNVQFATGTDSGTA